MNRRSASPRTTSALDPAADGTCRPRRLRSYKRRRRSRTIGAALENRRGHRLRRDDGSQGRLASAGARQALNRVCPGRRLVWRDIDRPQEGRRRRIRVSGTRRGNRDRCGEPLARWQRGAHEVETRRRHLHRFRRPERHQGLDDRLEVPVHDFDRRGNHFDVGEIFLELNGDRVHGGLRFLRHQQRHRVIGRHQRRLVPQGRQTRGIEIRAGAICARIHLDHPGLRVTGVTQDLRPCRILSR